MLYFPQKPLKGTIFFANPCDFIHSMCHPKLSQKNGGIFGSQIWSAGLDSSHPIDGTGSSSFFNEKLVYHSLHVLSKFNEKHRGSIAVVFFFKIHSPVNHDYGRKSNMEQKNSWFVDVFPFPRGTFFRFQALVFRGVIIPESSLDLTFLTRTNPAGVFAGSCKICVEPLN